ncbi:ABC transporter substrate-binding protein [Phormidium pseudopriestleyi]|uniref:ABC transporter substrate-binding protein n=1 Tax=Phormidium pseudopriestleyi TaxID=1759527 RepID=UPI0030F40CC0
MAIARHGLEKVNLEIGFVPLSACAPLAVANELGFFPKHGLDEVTLVRETSWRGIVDGMVGGYLDAAQMPSGMPLWLTLGGHENRPLPPSQRSNHDPQRQCHHPVQALLRSRDIHSVRF